MGKKIANSSMGPAPSIYEGCYSSARQSHETWFKVGRGLGWTFLPRRHKSGRQAQEETLNTTDHPGSAGPGHREAHCAPEMAGVQVRAGTGLLLAGPWYHHFAEQPGGPSLQTEQSPRS